MTVIGIVIIVVRILIVIISVVVAVVGPVFIIVVVVLLGLDRARDEKYGTRGAIALTGRGPRRRRRRRRRGAAGGGLDLAFGAACMWGAAAVDTTPISS